MKKLFLAAILTVALALPFPLYAGEVTITLGWEPNTESNLAGYNAYVSDTSGSSYTKFGSTTAGTEEIDFTFTGTGTTAIKKFFVVTAFNDSDPPLESDHSNEVYWIYNWAPQDFMASLEDDVILFAWKQASVELVKKWRIYSTETPGEDYQELAVIDYTGQPGPQYSTTESMEVPAGEKKTFYFVLVAFDEAADSSGTIAFSENSNEVSVTIDKTIPAPVYNVTIKVK